MTVYEITVYAADCSVPPNWETYIFLLKVDKVPILVYSDHDNDMMTSIKKNIKMHLCALSTAKKKKVNRCPSSFFEHFVMKIPS